MSVVESPIESNAECEEAIRGLVECYRSRCLWFLRSDHVPSSDTETRRVLEAIERHGDVAAFRQVARIRAWLSRDSSATSAKR